MSEITLPPDLLDAGKEIQRALVRMWIAVAGFAFLAGFLAGWVAR